MATPTHSVKVYYGKPMLPDVSRVLACLYEKEVKFELLEMYEGQTINPDLIRFQAARAPVSAFEDGNIRLFESRAICRHIVNKYAYQGNKYLLGRDLLERASIEQWLKSEEHSFDPPSSTLIFHLAFNVEPDQALITESERKLSKVLDVYEQRLDESKFLAGDEFSLADLSHLPNSHYLARSEEWGYLFDSRKNVKKWWKEISSRHSWQEVVKILDKVGICGKDVKKSSNGRFHFLNHKKLDLHSFDQTTTFGALSSPTEDLSDQRTPVKTQSSTQPTTAAAPSSPVQGKVVGPTTKEDSNGRSNDLQGTINARSSTQTARPDALPLRIQEKTIQSMHQVESSGQLAIPQDSFDSQSSTQLSIPRSMPIQKEGQEDSTSQLFAKEATIQPANIGAPSNKTKNAQSSAQSSTQLPDTLASKEQEKDSRQVNQADTTKKLNKQEDTKDALSSMLSSQKQEKISQPTGQANSNIPMTDQKAHLDAQSSNQETATGSLFSQKKENGGHATRRVDSGKSVAENATIDAQHANSQPAPSAVSRVEKDQIDQKTDTKQDQIGAFPSKKQETNAQSTNQGDSEAKSIPQRQTAKDVTDDQSSIKREENSQQTSQANSTSKTTVKQGITDAIPITKEGSFDAMSNQKQEQQAETMVKADKQEISQQSTAEPKSFTESPTPDSQSGLKQEQGVQQANLKQGSSDTKSSTQQNPPDAMSNQKEDQVAQFTGQAEIKGQPVSQQVNVNAQSSTASPIPGNQSSQQNEKDIKQTSQQNSTGQSIADQGPSDPNILTQQTPAGVNLNQKQEGISMETKKADSEGQSVGQRDTAVDNFSNGRTSGESASDNDSTGGSGSQSGSSSQSKD